MSVRDSEIARPVKPALQQTTTYEEVVMRVAATAAQEDKELVARVSKPGQVQHVLFLAITPAAAALILRDNNGINRTFVMAAALKYARIMQRGDWRCNKDTIAFDTTGKLRDGQHRLWAIASGAGTIRIGVTLGESVDAAEHYDGGSPRAAADILDMKGIEDSALRATVIKHAINYQQRLETGKSQSLDREQIVALAEQHGSTLAPAIALARRSREKPHNAGASWTPCLVLRDAATVAYLMLCGGWGTAEVGSFLSEFQLGQGSGEDSPILRGASILIKDASSKAKGGLGSVQRASLTLTVARLWATKTRQTLRAPKSKELAPYQRPEELPLDPIGNGMPLASTSERSN